MPLSLFCRGGKFPEAEPPQVAGDVSAVVGPAASFRKQSDPKVKSSQPMTAFSFFGGQRPRPMRPLFLRRKECN